MMNFEDVGLVHLKPYIYYRVKQPEPGEPMSETLKIGELARRSGCPVETIRYYEREDLVQAPLRSSGNYRIYGEKHLERLLFIRHCRHLDMTLDEVRRLLRFCDSPLESCFEVNALLDEHIGHVAERVAELQALEKRLKQLRRLCRQAQASKDCGILNELAHASADDSRRSRTTGHVRGAHGRVPAGKDGGRPG